MHTRGALRGGGAGAGGAAGAGAHVHLVLGDTAALPLIQDGNARDDEGAGECRCMPLPAMPLAGQRLRHRNTFQPWPVLANMPHKPDSICHICHIVNQETARLAIFHKLPLFLTDLMGSVKKKYTFIIYT